jgi:hypothetical protein
VTQGVAFETESRKRAQRRLRFIDAANCRGFNGDYEERPSFDGRRSAAIV